MVPLLLRRLSAVPSSDQAADVDGAGGGVGAGAVLWGLWGVVEGVGGGRGVG